MGTTLLDRIDGILDLVRDRADEVEAGRRIPDDVLAAVRGTGLNRAFLARDLGGDELPVPEVAEAMIRLGAADGSTAWCAAIGSGSNFFSGYLAPGVAAEIFSDPDAPNASMFGPYGTATASGDAYAFTGRWPFSSNCLHSGWIGLGAWFVDAEGNQEPIPRLAFVPMSEVEVEDTWTAVGLCGTGSHHTTVAGSTLTRDRSLTFVDRAQADGPLWRIPVLSVMAPQLGSVPLGIARGAVDEVARLIESGHSAQRGTLVDDPVAMADFAMADARLRAASSGLLDATSRVWETAERGERPGSVEQGRLMASLNLGCEVAVEVTSTCHRLGGGAAAYAGNRLLRALRDVETARQHIMFGFGSRPMLGQAVAGIPTFAPPLVT